MVVAGVVGAAILPAPRRFGHSVPGESVVIKLAADGTRQVCSKASVCSARKAYESR